MQQVRRLYWPYRRFRDCRKGLRTLAGAAARILAQRHKDTKRLRRAWACGVFRAVKQQGLRRSRLALPSATSAPLALLHLCGFVSLCEAPRKAGSRIKSGMTNWTLSFPGWPEPWSDKASRCRAKPYVREVGNGCAVTKGCALEDNGLTVIATVTAIPAPFVTVEIRFSSLGLFRILQRFHYNE